jgi:hypothetical protein
VLLGVALSALGVGLAAAAYAGWGTQKLMELAWTFVLVGAFSTLPALAIIGFQKKK